MSKSEGLATGANLKTNRTFLTPDKRLIAYPAKRALALAAGSGILFYKIWSRSNNKMPEPEARARETVRRLSDKLRQAAAEEVAIRF